MHAFDITTYEPHRAPCRPLTGSAVGSTHYGPDLEDADRETATDEHHELLTLLCEGWGRGLRGETRDLADDLVHDGLAKLTLRGYEPTAMGRALIGPVAQRWPRFALPSRGRHACRRKAVRSRARHTRPS